MLAQAEAQARAARLRRLSEAMAEVQQLSSTADELGASLDGMHGSLRAAMVQQQRWRQQQQEAAVAE